MAEPKPQAQCIPALPSPPAQAQAGQQAPQLKEQHAPLHSRNSK